MRFPHLFEFMDLEWLPATLQATLREILECGNARPFRQYYEWVADRVQQEIIVSKCENVVELGAGTAPITRVLAGRSDIRNVQLIACDIQPDESTYADLEKRFPGKVTALRKPIDYSKQQDWPPNTLLLLSGTFHHIPYQQRARVLKSITDSGMRVMVCEPLRKSIISSIFVFLSAVPAFLLPLRYIKRPGKLRRFFWCWLMPITALSFSWDGLVSWIRFWTENEWTDNLRNITRQGRTLRVSHTLLNQMVVW